MWHFYNASPAKPHYAALREILNAHSGRLAAAIDRQAAETAASRNRKEAARTGPCMAG